MAYYRAQNTGKDFITHEDNEQNFIKEYPGNVFFTYNTAWATRIGATHIELPVAQAYVNAAMSGSVYPDDHILAGQPETLTLLEAPFPEGTNPGISSNPKSGSE